MHNRRNDDDQKELVKEAIQEWLDKKFSAFGKWTFGGLCAALFIWIISIWLISHGQELKAVAGFATMRVTQ